MGCARSSTAVDIIESSPPAPLKAKAVPGRNFHREYALKQKLGQGAYGVVYAATHVETGNEQLVVKVIETQDAASKDLDVDENVTRLDRCRLKRSISHETTILKAVRGHENVCRMIERFTHGGLAYIVLERYDRTLREALESLATMNEETFRPLFQGMLTGLAAIHARRIMHRDVKPDNFMCSGLGNTVKLCDFGLACTISSQGALKNTEYTGVCGTAAYIAPEMLQKEGYGAKVDVWSFGVVVHVLLRGSFPYTPHETTKSSTMAAILHGVPTPEIFLEASANNWSSGDMSEDAGHFIVSMLSRCAKKRPTSQEALRDEFFSSRSLSLIRLRRKFEAAKACGAFDDTNAMKADIGGVDVRLRQLQDGHCQLSSAETRSSASEVSTDTGSSVDDSEELPKG